MIGTDVARAAQLLGDGKLVAIPTETVYGLAANALDPEAVAEIYHVKNRPEFNPLILHISSAADAAKYVTDIPELAKKLMDAFWPGSLSILLPKSNLVPDIITAGSSHVVLRVPNHWKALELLQQLDYPLAAPSANISNTVSPTTAQHVEEGLGSQISYVLDGGECTVGLESTIVAIEPDGVRILREGGISQEQILQIEGVKLLENELTDIQSPGQLKKHYSTIKPLYIVESISDYLEKNPNDKCSALLYEDIQVNCTSYLLSQDYNLAEIANNLFATMRKADADENDIILIEKVKEEGIGRAVADRLRRAGTARI